MISPDYSYTATLKTGLQFVVMFALFYSFPINASFTSPKTELHHGNQTYYVHLLGSPVLGSPNLGSPVLDTPVLGSTNAPSFSEKSDTSDTYKPSVIILGGGPGFSSWNLEPIQKRLASTGYYVALMDMAGIGENRHIVVTDPIESWIVQIKLLVEHMHKHMHKHMGKHSNNHLDEQRKVTLVGHSWGAIMAMLYLRAHPDDIDKVVFLNPVDADKKAMQHLTAEIDERNREELQSVWDDELAWHQQTEVAETDIERITLRQIQQVLPTYFLDYEQGKRYADQFGVDDFDIDLNVLAWQRYDENRIRYDQIRNSAHFYFMECKQDYLMPYNIQAMQPELPFREINVIDQCGHFPWIEQEAAFYKHLTTFLEDDHER